MLRTEDLEKLEGLENTYTDGERVFGRIVHEKDDPNLTERGKSLVEEVKKNPTKFTRQYDDNMISGDDGTKIAQKQPNTPNIPEEVIIIPHFSKKTEEVIIPSSPEKSEEKKEVANEAITGKNIEKSAESGVNKKTLMIELTDEEIKKWEAKNNEVRADLNQQNELKQQKVREKIKQQKDHD